MKPLMRVTILGFDPEASFRAHLRVAWGLIKFVARFNRSTPEQQDRIMTFLASQPGVTVSKRKV